ncbi:type II toxin-antitoxin system RelE/ParE family toxin [Synergistaceae bacterium OttesenSCG-928-I11]|nr:type II toxin-antitoxin system RelE/ParE family toxin [Synergistaceae bacterium OttesenSCG-928-I11]
MESRPKRIVIYTTPDGKKPFSAWFHGLKDKNQQRRVVERIDRVEEGNYGDYKSIGDGILELRFKIGLRVYFAEKKDVIVLLFCGGDKKTQSKDIAKAKEYLKEFENRYEEIES